METSTFFSQNDMNKAGIINSDRFKENVHRALEILKRNQLFTRRYGGDWSSMMRKARGLIPADFPFYPLGVIVYNSNFTSINRMIVLGGTWGVEGEAVALLKFVRSPDAKVTAGDDPKPMEHVASSIAASIGVGPQVYFSRYSMDKYHGSPIGVMCTSVMVMDYVGIDLFTLSNEQILDNNPLVKLELISSVCEKLVRLGLEGLTHGDIKLENVCVNLEVNSATLIDFGLSNFRGLKKEDCGGKPGLHKTSGTFFVMPPEKKHWDMCDCKVDFDAEETWLMGVLIFEFFNYAYKRGTHPWTEFGSTNPTWAFVDAAMGELMGKCFKREPSERISPGEVLERIIKIKALAKELETGRAKLVMSDPDNALWGKYTWEAPGRGIGGDSSQIIIEINYPTKSFDFFCSEMLLYIENPERISPNNFWNDRCNMSKPVEYLRDVIKVKI